MGGIRLRRNFSFEKALVPPGKAAMRQAGLEVRDRIVTRTQSGLDENRRKFTPYPHSKATVDLTDTGQMLEQDFQPVEVTDRSVGLGFRTVRSEQIADAHINGKGRLPPRRFLGVPQSWLRDIKTILIRRWRP